MPTCHKYATIVKRRKNKRTKKKGLYIYAFTRLFMRILNFRAPVCLRLYVYSCACVLLRILIYAFTRVFMRIMNFRAPVCLRLYLYSFDCVFCLVAMTYLRVPTTWLTRSHH